MRSQREEGRLTNWRMRGNTRGSDQECSCKGRRNDSPTGGREGTQGGQIMNAVAKGGGTTHQLEDEREHKGVRSRMQLQREEERLTNWRTRGNTRRSDHECGRKGRRDNSPSGGREGTQGGQIKNAAAKGG